MIHATGQVGRPSLCHRHILYNWELALGSWETGTERKADCGQECQQCEKTKHTLLSLRVSEEHGIRATHEEGLIKNEDFNKSPIVCLHHRMCFFRILFKMWLTFGNLCHWGNHVRNKRDLDCRTWGIQVGVLVLLYLQGSMTTCSLVTKIAKQLAWKWS